MRFRITRAYDWVIQGEVEINTLEELFEFVRKRKVITIQTGFKDGQVRLLV